MNFRLRLSSQHKVKQTGNKHITVINRGEKLEWLRLFTSNFNNWARASKISGNWLFKILYPVIISTEWVSKRTLFSVQEFQKYSSNVPPSLRKLLEDVLHQKEILSQEREGQSHKKQKLQLGRWRKHRKWEDAWATESTSTQTGAPWLKGELLRLVITMHFALRPSF